MKTSIKDSEKGSNVWMFAFLMIIILFLVLGIGLLGYLFLTQKNITPIGPYALDIPPAVGIDEVVERLGDINIDVPGPASEGTLEEVTFGAVIDVGDAIKMKEALSGIYAASGMDMRITSVLTTPSSSVFCINWHYPWTESNIPLIKRVESGEVRLIPGLRYCVGYTKIGELYAGVPQADLQDFTLNTVDYIVVNPETKVVTTTQKVDVVINARFGLLTHSVQEGNEDKITYEDPNRFMASVVDAISSEEEYVRIHIDRSDNLANELATLELIAPFWDDGSRDMKNLHELERLVSQYFNNPSPDLANPWPYDHLRAQAEVAAISAGYQGLESFTVNLEWPYEEGVWYYLQGLDTDPQLVIDPTDDEKFKDNLYNLWRGEIIQPLPKIE